MSDLNIVVGVDATRNRSGGAVAHIRGLVSGSDPRESGINKVHLWSYSRLLANTPDKPWLEKHEVAETNQGLINQLSWQYYKLPRILEDLNCSVVFNTDAGSVCPSRRSVTLSQDMLSFEPGEMQRYGLSKARLRLEILKSVQARSLKRSRLAIYLTNYARQIIENQIGGTSRNVVIPHGIDNQFISTNPKNQSWPDNQPIKCIYVSNAAPYKHQWQVIEAIAALRRKGYFLTLTLVGGGTGKSQERVDNSISYHDPQRQFIFQEDFAPNEKLPSYLAESNLFIFASSCENLPITLLEAMAFGLPICSSNRGPMPEVLGSGGCYFDPEVPSTIAESIQRMIDNEKLRRASTEIAIARSRTYSWERCATETWKALVSVSD